MNSNIKGIIFDYGKVISTDQPPDILKEMRKLCPLSPEVFDRLYYRYRDEYDRGELTAKEYWHYILSTRMRHGTYKIIGELIRLDNRSWSEINQVILDWALNFKKKGIKTALLSNMPFEFHEYIKDRIPWLNEFDPVVLSYKLGISKPNSEIYQYCLNKMDLAAEEVIFIDDNVKNIYAANRLGINTIHFKSYEQAIEEMNNKFNL